MFSFIHTADIHLDSPLRGLNQHADAPIDQIRRATRRALENLVSLALDKCVDFIVIAGDLYDGDWPDYSTGLFFNKQMSRLKEAQITVYLISGNHDAASKITKNLKPPSNVKALSTKKPETIFVDGLPVAIHGQGFATPRVPENLSLEYPAATPEFFNIGMLHTSLTGNPEHDPYAPCSINNLTEKGYDYWALGHIHQHAIIQENPHIVYSGNPQGRHIKETGERGCYLVDVDDQLTIKDVSFKITDVVRWEALEINITDLVDADAVRESIAQHIETTLAETNGRLLALRITLFGDSALHDQLHAELAQWQAECVSLANEIEEDMIWFERLRIKTKPTYNPQELAERDDLTKLVLEALEHFTPSQVPTPVIQLSERLKSIDSKDLRDILTLSEPEEQLKQDVSAIVLQSISTSSISE
ncbi:MAG: metallophosphoesterase [Rubritalea sp.]|uniref:metallophosphoesterase n=1 Tax=Rubritalea sp. TaxID=2109375 RepID=UPI003242118A